MKHDYSIHLPHHLLLCLLFWGTFLFYCAAQPCTLPDTCDQTTNDYFLWNHPYWWDKTHRKNDLFEMPIDLKVRLDSICPQPGLQVQYTLLLDLDNNGVTETIVQHKPNQAAGVVYFENAFQPAYTDGFPLLFDKRTVPDPALDRYRFALEVTPNGTGITAALRFNTARDSTTFVLPQLPHGKHRIQWFVRDACGKEKTCAYTFEIKDCEKPTVKCKNNLSISIQQTGIASLSASDLFDEASDNCSLPVQLIFAISKERPLKTSFPRDPLTNMPVSWVYFDCCQIGQRLLTLWVEDEAGNFNACSTLVTINSYTRCSCGPEISGSIKTVQNKGIKDATVRVDFSAPYSQYPRYATVLDSSGYYEIRNTVSLGGSTRFCPQLNEHPLNGVTTLDLAQITKHILGLETFDSPYTRIAADVNASGTITTFDVVELRKLILGIYDTFPNNQSWRFVRKSYVFPDPNDPFSQAFPECAAFSQLYNHIFDLDFIGIKIGDVNYTARTGLRQTDAADRTPVPHGLALPNRFVLSGDVFEVHFQAENALLAQQFTLHFPHLELLEILPATAGMDEGHFAHFPPQHLLTHAWNSEQASGEKPQFALRFRALAAGRLSELLALTEAPTPALAYDMEGNPFNLDLQFNAPQNETATTGLVLLQNQPNPFSHTTTIGFYLPQDDQIQMSIFDATGKILLQRDIFGTKGFNQTSIGAESQLPSGILYCKMATSTGEATQKMVRQ